MPSQSQTVEDARVAQRAMPENRLGGADVPSGTDEASLSPKWAALLEEYRAERDELRRRMQLIPRARQNAAIQISELEKALLSIRQARDNLVTQVHTLSHSKERTKGRIDELMQELELVREQSRSTEAELEASRSDCEAYRAQLQKLEENRAASARIADQDAQTEAVKESALAAELEVARGRIAALEAQTARSAEQHKESNARLIQKVVAAEADRAEIAKLADTAHEQLAMIAEERDTLRLEFKKMETRVSVLQVEIGRLRLGESVDEQIRKQQQQIADLSAQLDSARDELRLAWEVAEPAEPVEEDPVPLVLAEPPSLPLNAADADESVAAILAGLTAATESLEPEKHLKLVEEKLREFAHRALCAGWLSSRRILEVCGDIAKWLQKVPVKLETMVMPVSDALALVAKAARSTGPGVHAETDGLDVYAVDDDMENCECIAMSLEKIALRTRYASRVEIALSHLAANKSALILLDVDLGGGVSGFEIHTAIRRMAHHVDTPIVFVSALTSARERVEKIGSAKDSYLAKPYNLYELSLRALSVIMSARLAA